MRVVSIALFGACLAAAAPALAQTPAAVEHPLLHTLAAEVQPAKINHVIAAVRKNVQRGQCACLRRRQACLDNAIRRDLNVAGGTVPTDGNAVVGVSENRHLRTEHQRLD